MSEYLEKANMQTSPESVEIKTIIEITLRKGSGIEKDPVRTIKQYWDLDGNFLFEKDSID